MTLDLNGCKISNGSTMGTDYLVSIAANADVSIVGNRKTAKFRIVEAMRREQLLQLLYMAN